MRDKVAVITGASKGIGWETAQVFHSRGYMVYDLSRSGKDNDVVSHIRCDVSRAEDVDRAIGEVIRRSGHIDTVISNAGFGISGSVEGHSYDHIKRQIDVNFLGASYLAKATLPHIRASKGRIIFISSVAACVPIPFQAMYSATKAAVMTLALALDNELAGSGARALVLLPGDLQTGFTGARIKNKDEAVFYDSRVSRSVTKMEEDEQNGMTPDHIARNLYALALARRPKPMGSVGWMYRMALVLAGRLPIRLKQWIIKQMYA